MERKRPADVVIKPDPDAKRVKREGGDRFDLASLPMAPATRSASVAVKSESGLSERDVKPSGAARPSFGGPSQYRKRRGGHSILVRRGGDTARAHFKKRDMVVDITVRRAHDATWESSSVEREIFQRLNAAHMNVEPIRMDYGSIHRFLQGFYSEFGVRGPFSFGNVTGIVETPDSLEFTCSVAVQAKREGSVAQVTEVKRGDLHVKAEDDAKKVLAAHR